MQPQDHSTMGDDRLFDGAIERILARVSATAQADLTGFPHYADVDSGIWTTSDDGFWTGGYWPGLLWLSGYYSGDKTYWQAAATWAQRLKGRVESETAFRGFLFFYGACLGGELAQDPAAESLALAAARSVQASFNHQVGLIPLGAKAEEAHTVGENETNIDSISASLLLMWAGQRRGDEGMKQIALTHALRNADCCVRADGSVCQSASFNAQTGQVLHNYTHKGYSETSTWTRAQAWAMLGYAYLAGRAPEEPRLLELADRTCRWWMQHVPDDGVAYWDFDAPVSDQPPRDTSGTAIAAAALLKLANTHTNRDFARRCQRFARETVRTLCVQYLTPTSEGDQRPPGILTHGCFDPKRGVAVENELVWGDYYLLEALGGLTGLLPLGAVNL